MDQYSTKNVNRRHLQAIMDYLDMKDISYSFDGPGETIEFDITELGRKQQEMVNKLLNPVNESKLSKWINKIITEELQRVKEGSADEINDIAVDLIDYLGAQLPPQISPRALNFFRELGYKDTDPMVRQIYQTALNSQ